MIFRFVNQLIDFTDKRFFTHTSTPLSSIIASSRALSLIAARYSDLVMPKWRTSLPYGNALQHVQTSDACVLPKGTGYISDLGMTGAIHSVLGIDVEQSIGKFMGDPPRRYESAGGKCSMEGCIFEIDPETGRCLDVESVRLI
mgnify:CR=1 FL=1